MINGMAKNGTCSECAKIFLKTSIWEFMSESNMKIVTGSAKNVQKYFQEKPFAENVGKYLQRQSFLSSH